MGVSEKKAVNKNWSLFSEEMYKECQSLTDFINEDIRKFACAALIHLGHAIFKVNGNPDALHNAVDKGVEMILQDTDTGCALLIMAEISEVLDDYKKPINTQKLCEVVKQTMSSELICMMGRVSYHFFQRGVILHKGNITLEYYT